MSDRLPRRSHVLAFDFLLPFLIFAVDIDFVVRTVKEIKWTLVEFALLQIPQGLFPGDSMAN